MIATPDFRGFILLSYRVLGPLVLAFLVLGEAVSLGWVKDPAEHDPGYTLYIMIVMAAVFSMPVVAAIAIAGSVRFARDWPFVLPLWLVTALVLAFAAPLVLTDSARAVSDIEEVLFTALAVAAALAATIIGYWPRKR